MTTSELVDRLAANWELEPVETRKVLDAAVQNMCDQLAQGNDFSIPGLGTFRTITTGRQRIFDEQEQHYKMLPPERKVRFESNAENESNQNGPEAN